MNDLITEARELCDSVQISTPSQAAKDLIRAKAMISELCDALEKAKEQNKQLLHEVCKLACESVKRDKALARLEAEVMAMMEDKPCE